MELEPISFVLFKWKPLPGYRSKFDGNTVNVMARMIKRHYHGPHRIICLTDDATGIDDPDVEIYELWDDLAQVPNPNGRKNPSCYRRLRLFAKHPGEWLGSRFVAIDLDAVILDDITPLFNPAPETGFKIWRSGTWNVYNGSLWYLRAGARPEVWKDFHPVLSPREAIKARCRGSDQGWIAFRLGPDEDTWDTRDGVVSFNIDIRDKGLILPPPGARVVFMHGHRDPWDKAVQAEFPWIQVHYR